MGQDDSTGAVTEGIVGRSTTGDQPGSLFDPSGDARAAARRVFETRAFEGESLRMGQVLRRAREIMGLDLKAIKAATGISDNYLMAIERMEIGPIPKGYLVPYLLKYAREIGLPAEDVAAAYTHECGAVEDISSAAPVPKIGSIRDERSGGRLSAVVAVIVLALAAAGGWYFFGGDSSTETAAAPGIVSINGARESLFADSADRQRPATDALALELKAVRQGWLEVRGADGTIFRSRVLAEGESYFPRLGGGWTVSARDGGAFEWRVGNTVIAPLGPDGAAVFSVSVDEKLALATEMMAPDVAGKDGAPVNP